MLMPRLRKALRRRLCGSAAVGLAVPLFSLLAVSASFAQAPALPAVQSTAKSLNFKDGKVSLEECRIRAYTYLGGNGPLLVVNGTRDAGNPVVDLVSTYQSAKEGDLWLLGRGEHCAVEYWPVMIPQMADWLTEKINK
jgi:hypothetical protein